MRRTGWTAVVLATLAACAGSGTPSTVVEVQPPSNEPLRWRRPASPCPVYNTPQIPALWPQAEAGIVGSVEYFNAGPGRGRLSLSPTPERDSTEITVRLDSAGIFRVSLTPGRYYARFLLSSDTAPAPILVVAGAADTVRIRSLRCNSAWTGLRTSCGERLPWRTSGLN
jgi:hypothetical protein